MAATLIHQKSFMKNLDNGASNGSDVGEGGLVVPNGSDTKHGSQSSHGAAATSAALLPLDGMTVTGSDVDMVQTILPVTTSLIHTLLPNHHNNHHQTASRAAMLHHLSSAPSNFASPFFGVSSPPTLNSSTISGHKITQHRCHLNSDSKSGRLESRAISNHAADGVVGTSDQQIYLNQQPSSQQTFMLTSLETESASGSSSPMSGSGIWDTIAAPGSSSANFTSSVMSRSDRYDICTSSSLQLHKHYQPTTLTSHASNNTHLSPSSDSCFPGQQDYAALDESNSDCASTIFSDTNGFDSPGGIGSESLRLRSTNVGKHTDDTIPVNLYCSAEQPSLTTGQYSHVPISEAAPSGISFNHSQSFASASSNQLQPSDKANSKSEFNGEHFGTSTLLATTSGVDVRNTVSVGGSGTTPVEQANDEQEGGEPEIDIVINNVVCSFSVRCHLNLRDIALNGDNVEFRRENGMVTMKLRRPYTTASIWSSGKITCTGATSEDQAKIAARRYTRCLQKLGFNVRFRNFRIVNVLGTCSMPWGIMIVNFSEKYKKDASYEPELHPGVTYRLERPRATLKIFSTGSITVTAASVDFVQAAIEHIFPLVYEFRKKRTIHEKLEMIKQQTAFDVEQTEALVVEECDIHLVGDQQMQPHNTAEPEGEEEREEHADGQENYIDYSDARQRTMAHNRYNQPTITKANFKNNTIRADNYEKQNRLELRHHSAELMTNGNGMDIA